MTSKNLFFNLMKEDLKRRLWTIALSILMFFIGLTLVVAIAMSEEMPHTTYENIMYQVSQMITSNNPFILIITIVGAIVCGLSAFYYLHSKKKVDLYHSIPLKREKIFAVNFINGLFIYIVPYFINLLITFIIIQVNGYMNMELIKAAMFSFAINTLFYALIYTLTVIAVMLTGNVVISFFGTMVFLGYGPLLMIVKEIYFSEFFKNYANSLSQGELLTFLSPLGSYIRLAGVQIRRYTNANLYQMTLPEDALMGIVKTLIILIVLIGFALYLFKKRPSEAAGKAMSFQISKPIIKFLLVVPLTLLGGIIFKQVSSNSSSAGWFIFGIIFIFFVISAIIEIIFNFDIRAAFQHKRQLLLCAVVVAIISAIFQLDLFKHDSYLPSEDKINYISVNINGLDNNISYIDMNTDPAKRTYISNENYHLKYVKLHDFANVYTLIKSSRDHEHQSGQFYTAIRVKFVLKNGKEVERNYPFSTEKNSDIVAAIYNSKEFKETHFQIFSFKAADILGVSCDSQNGSKDLTLSEQEKQELLDLYKQEVSLFKAEDLKSTQVVANINFKYRDNQYTSYEVYSNFTKTIEFLKNHGYNDFYTVTADKVNSLVVNYYDVNMKNEDVSYSRENNEKTYTDKKDIEAILGSVIDERLYYNNYSMLLKDDSFDIYIRTANDEYGNMSGAHYFFRKDSVPDFVKKDFGIKD